MKRIYQIKLLLLCAGFLVGLPPMSAQDLTSDSLALVDLYNDCGGTEWVGFDNWLNGPISTWEQVTVDSAMQRVTNVVFKDMELSGTLPASLGNMDEMSGKIEFRDDKGLTGALPAFLWNWTKVERFQIKFSGYTSIDTTGMSNMVNLTEFNSEGTPIAGMAPGVIFTLPSMVKVYLHDCKYDQLPPELLSATGLDRLYLNGNMLTEIPDMSGIAWKSGAKVRVHNNALTFEDLEPNVGLNTDPNVAEFRISPQATVGMDSYVYANSGDPVSIASNVGGTANVYTWIKDEAPLAASTANYDIASFDPATQSGSYRAVVQSTIVPGLDISTGITNLFESASAQDSLALVDLYNTNGGANWTGFDTWLNGPLDTWEQVTVDSASQRVTHVSFKQMDLTGTLPNSLGNLTEMSGKIEFHDDLGMTGELPAAIWNWTKVDRFQLKRSGITSINTTGLENMVNLTEYNTEKNPIPGTPPGVVFTLPAMVKVYLHDCEYDALPDEILSASGLDRLYLNGNKLTDLPDMSGITWKSGAKLRFQNNSLTFEDLESNVVLSADTNVAEFNFSPQATVGTDSYLYTAAGDPVSIAANVGGTANVYTWIKDGTPLSTDSATFYIANFDPATESGSYHAVVQNTLVTGLDISTGVTSVFESAFDQDSLALVDLYNTSGGTNWTGFDNWLTAPLSTWEQVTLDSATQRVTHVSFKQMDLAGTLPASLGNLTQMSGKIEMHDDSLLVGELPNVIWKWVNVDRFQLKRTGITSINLEGMENMVNLTEYNTEKNAIGGIAPGVVFTLPAMVKVYLHDCEYDAIPDELLQAQNLDRLYFNGNKLVDIPDMSGMSWGAGAKIRFQDNFLTFEDLEANVSIPDDTLVAEFNYSPQANVGMASVQDLATGDTLNINIPVGGTANQYTWIIDGTASSTTDMIYNVDSVTVADAGYYTLLVQNTLVPGLDIMSEIYQVNVDGVTSINDPAFFGEIKVFGNPMSTNLRIESTVLVEDLLIFDMSGKQIAAERIMNTNIDLPVADLKAGVYVVMLKSGDRFHTLKVVKR